MPMTCEGCVKDVSDSLYKLDGIAKVEANLQDQLVRVEGTGMAPSGRPHMFLLQRASTESRPPSYRPAWCFVACFWA